MTPVVAVKPEVNIQEEIQQKSESQKELLQPSASTHVISPIVTSCTQATRPLHELSVDEVCKLCAVLSLDPVIPYIREENQWRNVQLSSGRGHSCE